MIDPNDYVITRKRKKYRFAKFANAANCYELDEWHIRQIDSLEIGAGTGLFSVELAARHPERSYLALDVKADRLQKGAYQALERGLKNVYFVRARADQIHELFPPHSLDEIWLTFPDPFPRARSSRRRLTHPYFLERYAELLAVNGALYLKHDNPDFFQWSLEQLVASGWDLTELSFDLHNSKLADDYQILTTYEQRWLSAGLGTNFVKASFR